MQCATQDEAGFEVPDETCHAEYSASVATQPKLVSSANQFALFLGNQTPSSTAARLVPGLPVRSDASLHLYL